MRFKCYIILQTSLMLSFMFELSNEISFRYLVIFCFENIVHSGFFFNISFSSLHIIDYQHDHTQHKDHQHNDALAAITLC
jgi:hypothetical protein